MVRMGGYLKRLFSSSEKSFVDLSVNYSSERMHYAQAIPMMEPRHSHSSKPTGLSITGVSIIDQYMLPQYVNPNIGRKYEVLYNDLLIACKFIHQQQDLYQSNMLWLLEFNIIHRHHCCEFNLYYKNTRWMISVEIVKTSG